MVPTVAVAGAALVTVSFAPQATVNAAAFDVTLAGLVMTSDPDPLALSPAAVSLIGTPPSEFATVDAANHSREAPSGG